MGQVELFNTFLYLKSFNYVQTNELYWTELLMLDRNTWNQLTVCKQISTGSLKRCYLQNISLQIRYLIYLYKQDLALNNPQELICHKTTNHVKEVFQN